MNKMRRALVQAEMQEDHRRFRLAFESAPIGMMVRDSNLKVLQANKALQDMLGFSEDELAKCGMETLTHEEDKALGKALNLEIFSGRRESYQLENRYRHKDGREVWCKVDSALVRDSAGRPQLAVSMIEDITARKHVEETIKRTLNRYELILNAARWGVVGMNAARAIVFANPAALAMLDWTGGALIGESIDAILHAKETRQPDNGAVSAILGAVSDGLIRHVDGGILRCRNGAPLPVECTIVPIVEDGKVSGATLIFRDAASCGTGEAGVGARALSEQFRLDAGEQQ